MYVILCEYKEQTHRGMKRKYRLRRKADNPFTKLTGKPVIKLSGASSCIVVDGKIITAKPYVSKPTKTKVVAAYLYLSHPSIVAAYPFPPPLITDGREVNEHSFSISDIKKVKQICKIDQCVNPDHLIVTLQDAQGWG